MEGPNSYRGSASLRCTTGNSGASPPIIHNHHPQSPTLTRKGSLAAVRRLLDYYTQSAFKAEYLIYPHRDRVSIADSGETETAQIEDYRQAMEWLTIELPNLLAIVDSVARSEIGDYGWKLPWALASYLYRQGHWRDYANTQSVALATAQRLGDHIDEIRARRSLGHAWVQLGHYDEALAHLVQSLTLCGQFGDDVGAARTHLRISELRAHQAMFEDAHLHARKAVDLYKGAGHQVGEARALNQVGWCRTHVGDLGQAFIHCQRALALLQTLNDRNGEAHAMRGIGYIYHQLGQCDLAITHYCQSVDMWRKLRHQYEEADTLRRLGTAQFAVADVDSAKLSWHQALIILERLNHRDAAKVRTLLAGNDSS